LVSSNSVWGIKNPGFYANSKSVKMGSTKCSEKSFNKKIKKKVHNPKNRGKSLRQREEIFEIAKSAKKDRLTSSQRAVRIRDIMFYEMLNCC
jgi:hypothetical protein